MFRLIPLHLLIWFLSAASYAQSWSEDAKLDLSSWTSPDGLSLDRGWYMLEGVLLNEQSFKELDKLYSLARQGDWRTQAVLESSSEEFSFFLPLGKNIHPGLGIYLSQFNLLYQMYLVSIEENQQVNFQLLSKVGSFDEFRVPEFRPIVSMLPSRTSADNYLLILTRDSDWLPNNMGAINDYPELVLYEEKKASLEQQRNESSWLLGVFLFLGLLNLLIFSARPRDRSSVFVAGFSIAMSARFFATEAYLSDFFMKPELWLFHFQSISIVYSLPLGFFSFLGFIYYSFPKLLPRRLFLVSVYSFLAASLMVLSYQWHGSSELTSLGMSVALFYVGLSLFFSFKAYRQNSRGSKLLAIGIGILFAGYLNDVAIGFGLFKGAYFSHYSLVVFAWIQSIIVGRNFAFTFSSAEQFAEDLLEKEKARSQFFQQTSHELRTPLNGILGFLAFVLEGRYGSLTPQVRTTINKSNALARSLLDQVSAILDLAKANKGGLELRVETVSARELLSQVDSLAQGLAADAQQTSYSSKLISDDSTFLADRKKIETILKNLIGNAFKFRDFHRDNHIRVEVHLYHSTLDVMVSDTGIGIKKEDFDKILEEFGQVESSEQRSYEGSGIGLALVKHLVELMNGKLEIDSEFGKGSSFKVSIPSSLKPRSLEDPNEDQDIAFDVVAAEEPIAQIVCLDTLKLENADELKVLVVDDHLTNCEVIVESLKIDGYQVNYSLSGRLAIDSMKLDPPDLLILDLMMPDVSGQDVLAAVRADESLRSLPIILLTARASEEDRLFSLSIGADDYLPKPVIAEELRLRVFHLLERKHLIDLRDRSERHLKLEQETKALLVTTLLHKVNEPMNFISLGCDNFKKLIDGQKASLFALFGDDEDSDEQVAAVKANFQERYQSIESALESIQLGMQRARSSMLEIRSVSGIDGLVLEKFGIEKLGKSLEDRLEAAVGTNIHNIPVSIRGDLSIEYVTNLSIFSLVIELLLAKVATGGSLHAITISALRSEGVLGKVRLKVQGARFDLELSNKDEISYLEYLLEGFSIRITDMDDELLEFSIDHPDSSQLRRIAS